MTSLPETLYRRVNGEQALINHLYGHLWFRSPLYFRNIEGPQNDPTEGVGSYNAEGINHGDVTDDVPIRPEFLLSFSETAQATEKFRRGCESCVLELNDPTGLADFVRKEIINGTCPDAVTVEWRRVFYDRDEDGQLNRTLSPSEELRRKHFSKPPRYADESEWRLVITFERLPLQNRTLKLKVSNDIRGFWGNYWKD